MGDVTLSGGRGGDGMKREREALRQLLHLPVGSVLRRGKKEGRDCWEWQSPSSYTYRFS